MATNNPMAINRIPKFSPGYIHPNEDEPCVFHTNYII